MPSNENLLRLIIADESVNDAERLVSLLRNHGLAVRPTRVEDGEALQECLAAQAQDVLLCAAGLSELPVEAAVREVGQSGKDIPMLVLSDEDDAALRTEVMRLGVADLVSKHHEEHFRLAVRRELRNVRERRRVRLLDAQLRDTERRCHALLESSRDAIAYVHDGMHVFANHTYLERFGYESMEDLEGLPVLDLVATTDQAKLRDFLRARSDGNDDGAEIEVAIRNADGATEPVQMCFSPATWDGEHCTQVLIREQSQSAELQNQLASLSHRDAQTGLYNRPYFVQRLDHAISGQLEAEDGAQAGLLYLQPDNLQAIADNLGIAAVDRVIMDVAEIITQHVGDEDIAARYGDSAFAILLPNRNVHEALSLAETIRSDVDQHVSELDKRTITKSCSIGAAVVSDAVSSAEQALALAHEAYETARNEGGDRVHLHRGSESEQGGEADWRTRLRDALDGDGFRLLFQPIIALQGDQRARYEVRLRLCDESGNWIEPGEFLPQAERHGLSPEVDLWVARHTIAQLAEREADGSETLAFIKVSGPTLGSQRFVEEVAKALRSTGLPGERLIFQVGEPVAVTQLNEAKSLFKALKELRCGFSIDDFGSGLNPFQLLRHLPAEYVKLDQSLITELTSSDENQERVGEIIRVAHETRRQVIAGFLEEATVLATLWHHQVDLVQGHFLGEPSPEMSYDFSAMLV